MAALGLTLAVMLGAGLWWVFAGGPSGDGGRQTNGGDLPSNQDLAETTVRQLCSHCHLFPSPDVLPRSAWQNTIVKMSRLPGYGVNVPHHISASAVTDWYERQAPEHLSLDAVSFAEATETDGWERLSTLQTTGDETAFVSHVSWADVVGDAQPELLVCDMRAGAVLLGEALPTEGSLQKIADISNPARVEVADLDGDGRRDLLVANLGAFLPLDHNLGTVDWLQNRPEGFVRTTLAEGLGRVADVRPFDFDADGDLDLVVAEFGWLATGRLLLLVNETATWQQPRFEIQPLNGRHGAIHAPIADLDGDGTEEVVCLFAQGHELVAAHALGPSRQFTEQILYRAPHPCWGYSGLELVDFDADEDWDLLLTNGDMFDDGTVKPYHGISWLENRGGMEFEPHLLLRMPGVHRAEAADLDGDGDLDVVACALLTGQAATSAGRFPTLLWMERVGPRDFQVHVLERSTFGHATLDLGDPDGDGDVDIAVGHSVLALDNAEPETPLAGIWINRLREQAR